MAAVTTPVEAIVEDATPRVLEVVTAVEDGQA